ncbi:bacterial Ig-like domain-containing protein [Enterococcus casseliflavus]|uniref:bacterial Ig-like domain-containing protein n=1 Tax=Enterococcus casseliflavus TaxID=37734 RepID=UPI0013E2A421|nr:bacterial Ig-like domain-containing protein [Enterococcus casseliflavus]
MKNKHMHLFLVGLLFGSIVMNPVQALTDTLGIAPAQEQEAGNLLSESLNSFEKSENQEQTPDNKDVLSESETKENLLENETSSSQEDNAASNEEQADNSKELSDSQSSESDTSESMTDNADQNQIHKKDSKMLMTPTEASETFTYDLTVEYDPLKYISLDVDLPIPEKYKQDELYFRLTLGGDYGNFYEYKSNEKFLVLGSSHNNPVIGVNPLHISWDSFLQGWGLEGFNFLGFTVVIPYKDANGNDLFTGTYNVRFTNSHLTIKYVDESGNDIYPSRRIDDSTNQPYDVSTSDYIPEIPGYELDTSKLPVDAIGKFKRGEFTVTYVYQKAQIDYTDILIKDSTIYTQDTWSPVDNFIEASSKEGKQLTYEEFLANGGIVSGTVDTQTAGTYTVSYTLNNLTKDATIVVKPRLTAINVSDSIIYVGDPWQAEDNFESALDKDGHDVDFSALTVDASQADTSKAGSFKVTYTYDGVTNTAVVTVKEKQTAVNVHDSTIYVGDSWQAEDNFDSALDKDGNSLDFQDITVEGSVNTNTPGTYQVNYRYDGVTSTATIIVKANQTAVNVHDSTIYVGETWEAEDNFDSALDKDGNDVALSDLTVDASQADMSKAGTFEVTYTYDGVTSTAIVTVKEKMTAVNVHNSTIYVGDNWEAEDNFDNALDKDGNDVALSDLTVDASKADTSKAGSFEVTYTYDGVTSTAIVTVKEKMTAVNVHDSTIYVGDNWEAKDNFDSALDKDGNNVALSDLTVDASQADMSKAGTFEVTYTYDGVTSTAIVTVKEKMTAVNVHDSTIYVGDNWEAKDNFDSALDKDGNDVALSDLTVDASKADTSKAGTFEVTYTYDGITSTAIITVKEKMTAVNVHDSTIYVGDNWEAEDNFDSALDKDGNSIDFQDLTVDASKADTSKAGTFEVTYTYDGVTSTAIITVKEKMTAVNVHDSTIYVGDNWQAEDNFDITLDKDGNDVDFSALTVDASKADTSKAGSFEVTYTYDGVTSIAIVTVKEKMTAVNVHDSTIYVGDNWEAEDNFDGALDKAGNDVAFSALTVDTSQVDPSKAGSYKVTYSYDGITVTATITVKEKPSQEEPADDSEYTSQEQEKENQKKINSDSKKHEALPKTNESKSMVELATGFIIVLLVGVIFFWKKRKANKS